MADESLQSIAKALVADHKGLLAADESNPTAGKRLDSIGMESTEETRRQYRNVFLSTDVIGDYISGVILFEETLGQKANDGTPFIELLQQKDVIPGIKVDKGIKEMANFPGEKVAEGLDGLRDRLKEYYTLGTRFTKFRCTIAIDDGIPTDYCIEANAHVLARYAALVQEAGMVPVIEPEVLISGSHDLARSEEVTTKTLKATFDQIKAHKVQLDGLILKSSMVISGEDCPTQASPEEVAEATIRCFKATVPEEVPGIVFLSGGQTPIQATENLNAVSKINPGPWTISFSYARALQGDPLKVWGGKPENVEAAQAEFTKRLKAVQAANKGEYTPEMEK